MTRREAYAAWWLRILTMSGDRVRNPNLVPDAFKAGWDAAEEEARKERLELAKEHSRALIEAVSEARFQERQGEDYGSY